MDQASVVGFTLAYIATLVAVFLMLLPGFIVFTLLLVMAGAARLVSLLLSSLTAGLYRILIGRLHTRRGA